MKAREEGGVVDSRLNVYGVEGLKVAGEWTHASLLAFRSPYSFADLSIPPSNVGAVSCRSSFIITSLMLSQNTYSTALAVAEKAAVIIGDDLGIKGV